MPSYERSVNSFVHFSTSPTEKRGGRKLGNWKDRQAQLTQILLYQHFICTSVILNRLSHILFFCGSSARCLAMTTPISFLQHFLFLAVTFQSRFWSKSTVSIQTAHSYLAPGFPTDLYPLKTSCHSVFSGGRGEWITKLKDILYMDVSYNVASAPSANNALRYINVSLSKGDALPIVLTASSQR